MLFRSEVEEVLGVVAQAEVELGVVARDGLRARRVGVDDARKLGCQELAGTEPLARDASVLDGYEVRVRAGGALAREVAYFVAPPKPGVSNGEQASDFAMSRPAFDPRRREVWYTDAISGFYALRLTNGVWPHPAA